MNFSISKYNFYSSKFTTNSILSILNEKHSVLTKKQQILVINKQWKDFLERLPFANTKSFLYQPKISEDIENYRFTKQFNDAMEVVKNNPGVF